VFFSKVSYAQNCEDIVLARTLNEVEFGFYIDVGAWSPQADSVSKLFYDHGWCGINIDPVPDVISQFQEHRPRDMNIQIALSDQVGSRLFTVFPGTGWHTFYPSREQREFSPESKEILVQTTTLDTIIEKVGVTDIHWLKIDAEGAEFEILKGFSCRKVCPWIIVIESTLPNSAIKGENRWTSILEGKGYVFCLFDGLNEFWLSPEHLDLKSRLVYPAGVHDNYVKVDAFECKLKLESTLQELSELKRKIDHPKNSKLRIMQSLKTILGKKQS
jgi:FkbM family methyltransferase